jgi:hypothetical protein
MFMPPWLSFAYFSNSMSSIPDVIFMPPWVSFQDLSSGISSIPDVISMPPWLSFQDLSSGISSIPNIIFMPLWLSFQDLSSDLSPVSIAEQSKACTVYDRLNIEITGSNPAQGMDVCLCVSVFCCPVYRWRPCIGLIPQLRSPNKCLWIEKSIKEGQGL